MTTRMPRDLPASPPSPGSSARRRSDRALTPAPDPGGADPAPRREAAPPPMVQEGALSEIQHELGNFFHRLYYWLDRVGEARPGGDATAPRMLEETVRTLEDFLATTLEYFHPISLTPVRMAAGEVVAGLCARVPDAIATDAPAVDGPHGVPAGTLLVDPARLPEVLVAALRRLVAQAPAGTAVRIGARDGRHAGGAGLALELSLDGDAGRLPAFHDAAAALAWARAQRVAALHGGELAEHTAADGERTVALFLPYSD